MLPVTHKIERINGNWRATLNQSVVGVADISLKGILFIAICIFAGSTANKKGAKRNPASFLYLGSISKIAKTSYIKPVVHTISLGKGINGGTIAVKLSAWTKCIKPA